MRVFGFFGSFFVFLRVFFADCKVHIHGNACVLPIDDPVPPNPPKPKPNPNPNQPGSSGKTPYPARCAVRVSRYSQEEVISD